ncbi:sugar ABC transporter ATP-binding protein [Anaerococcus sp. NML200574]|uniref:sugar ABC transporter ATP-binding protein n=1 Tax=Anaerococcus sp. NML200574 TaxID=2954486 RepID=UPI00223808D4|nr:sugar ABC transporter ATP-binding protein [Anaerococcus sp. NML200574]MCW6678380.1 sugar ABC transporter ATP-binding protein [Anaerococcus sp. NML200574]
MTNYVLEMKNISKKFGIVTALENAYLALKEGEVHALVGENGAGKSTLMKILGGIYSPNTGDILIDGEKTEINDVLDAQSKGISIIHQEIVMVPELSVGQNIFLGREPRNKYGLIDYDKIYNDSNNMLKEFGLDIDSRTKVGQLNIANQQLVEIIKAISFNVKILVMDEPTSSLSDKDVEVLFKLINSLKKSGISIVYITHRFEEIFKITDTITVMRDGNYINTVKTKDTNSDELVSMMVGREIESLYSNRVKNISDRTALEVKNLNSDVLNDINFNVRAGEIVGFAGLVGSGRSELMETIFGIRDYSSGEILIDNKGVVIKSVMDAMHNGIGLVPENRKEQGLVLNNSINFNITLPVISEFTKNQIIDERMRKDLSKDFSDLLKIKSPNVDFPVVNLSGGNQQKVVIGKWLATKPKILILDEPTKGVDVGARSEIYQVINNLSEEGIAVIIVSSDLPEIINMVDRSYVMRGGSIVGEVSGKDINQEKIMHYATGGR